MSKISTKLKILTAVLSVTTLVAGCSTLPQNTDPQVLRSFSGSQSTQEIAGPTPNQDPDLLIRGFFSAGAYPTQQYEAAKAYLTEGTRSTWNPAASTRILDRIDLNTLPGSTNAERTIAIRGTQVGTLLSGGVYQPENAEFEAEITMRREDGEWRIDALPDGILLERNDLRNHYTPHDVYFFDPSGQVLVGDRRWLFNESQSMSTVLMALLVNGPSPAISPGVVNQLSTDASFVGSTMGSISSLAWEIWMMMRVCVSPPRPCGRWRMLMSQAPTLWSLTARRCCRSSQRSPPMTSPNTTQRPTPTRCPRCLRCRMDRCRGSVPAM